MSTKTISRKAKGVIAVVAGGALLLGGGATFALWQDTATVTGRTITAGGLKVAAEGFTWDYTFDGETYTPVPEDLLIIPGMGVRGTAMITPTVNGTDLVAELTFQGGAWSTTFLGETPLSWTLNDVPMTNTSAGNAAATLGKLDIPAAESEEQIKVQVELILPGPSYRDNKDNNALRETGTSKWTLADIGVTLTQK